MLKKINMALKRAKEQIDVIAVLGMLIAQTENITKSLIVPCKFLKSI